ncbi:MAG: DNA polymerase I, partial [Aquificota bacterium]
MAQSLSLPLDRPSLYLIDGSSYLYRAYFALPFLSNSKGIPTHAAYGFTRMVMKIVKEHQPQYMAVAFDVGRETFRTETYQEYKAQRPSMPDELAVQIPYVKEILQALRIPVLEMENYEADDVIATLAKRAETAGFQVVIVTGDKDMLQLVTENIQVFDPMKEAFYGPQEVEKRMGVAPHQIPDLLGLAGDSIDNIPGVKGIGQKSA